jgi:hypothetical protein
MQTMKVVECTYIEEQKGEEKKKKERKSQEMRR